MVAGVCMCRDEADIIAATVGWMRSQVDLVIVADNGSVDGTREILDTLDVIVVDDPEVGYYQSRKTTALAQLAGEHGADWVVPFDADEIHLAADRGRIADTLNRLPDEILVSEAPLLDHVPTGTDPDDPDPVRRIGWRRRAQAPLRKVAARVAPDLTIHQGNHSAGYGQSVVPMVSGHIEVRHFPYRSPEQMVRKARNGAAAYRATNLPEDAGKHWRDYDRLTDEQIGEVFRKWFWSPDPAADPDLMFDPCPTLPS